jgi:hypothetical protein
VVAAIHSKGTTVMSRSTSTAPRASSLRKRFALVSAGLLSVLVAFLGVNFAGDTGTASSAITSTDGIEVTPATPPSWTVSVGSAGTVPSAGTIAQIDATDAASTKMLVSVYITNLDELALNYSSWNFNVELWNTAATPAQVGTTQVATSDSGTVSWVVDISATKVYALKLAAGGSFYTIGTDTTTGSLSPKFFVRATQL